MNELRKTTLGKEVDFLTGFPFKSDGYISDGVRLLRGDNIAQGSLAWDDAKKWPADERNKFELYELQEDDVVLAMDRPWVDAGLKYASVSKGDIPCLLVQRTARLRGGEGLDTKYLKYIIGSPQFSKYIKQITTGSLVPHISGGQIKDFGVHLPPLDAQKKIAAVLSAIDAKIDCNNRINAELEAMAKTLYDYWFVQFDFPDVNGKPYKSSGGKMVYNVILKREIPAWWRHSTIGETFKTYLGGTPSREKDEYWAPGEVSWLSSGENPSTFVVDPDERISNLGLQNSPAKILPQGTVIISIVRHLRVSILGIEAATNQSVVGVLETDKLKHCFIYPYLVREIPRLMALRTGAQQPHINKGVLDESLLVIPDESTLKAYASHTAPLFLQIKNYLQQNRELTQLRDWLLPLLMNGQVTVA